VILVTFGGETHHIPCAPGSVFMVCKEVSHARDRHENTQGAKSFDKLYGLFQFIPARDDQIFAIIELGQHVLHVPEPRFLERFWHSNPTIVSSRH
jgi:hypothetical protein